MGYSCLGVDQICRTVRSFIQINIAYLALSHIFKFSKGVRILKEQHWDWDDNDVNTECKQRLPAPK